MDSDAGLSRVVSDVFFELPLMAFVSENLIVRFLLPEGTGFSCELINASGCKRFP